VNDDRPIASFSRAPEHMLCVLGWNGYVHYVAPAFAQAMGTNGDSPVHRALADLVHTDDRDELLAQLEAVRAGLSPLTLTNRIVMPDGGNRRMFWTFRGDRAVGLIFAVARVAEDVPWAWELFREALDAAPGAIVVVNEAGAITVVNRAAAAMFGYERDELLGRPVELLVPQPVRTRHRSERQAFQAGAGARPMGLKRDLAAVRRDGTRFPVEIGLSPLETQYGSFVLAAVMDLTERKRALEELAIQARALTVANTRLADLAVTDGLTSLKNRQAFFEQLGAMIELTVRGARPLSVLILDVDYFKPYNDEFGHLAGDEVLRQVAEVLRDVKRRSDFVARLGGEEFGVILPETDAAGAVVLAERFRQAVERNRWPRRQITVSVGATTVEFDQCVPRPPVPQPGQLLASADRALYRAKEHGRNRVAHDGRPEHTALRLE
jgi:diguanylate cyclase (GGDEF)-like protein/PAS domain S-box-containing protein